VLLHLSHLVSFKWYHTKLKVDAAVFEKEISENPFLFASLKGDFDTMLKLLHENPKLITGKTTDIFSLP
jgi:hypothetical protein